MLQSTSPSLQAHAMSTLLRRGSVSSSWSWRIWDRAKQRRLFSLAPCLCWLAPWSRPPTFERSLCGGECAMRIGKRGYNELTCQQILSTRLPVNPWPVNLSTRVLQFQFITWQGPYGPCQVKRYSSVAKSAILSAHSSCRAKGVRLDVLCPCLRWAALCVIAKYKTTLYKFNWLKDKLPCLDSSASPAE